MIGHGWLVATDYGAYAYEFVGLFGKERFMLGPGW